MMIRLTLLAALVVVGCGDGGGGGQEGAGGMIGGAGGVSGGDCVPACGGLECGIDTDCGMSCGKCADGFSCAAGVCTMPTVLLENGATCSASDQCASQECGVSQIGEGRCYGSGASTDPCSDTFDCLGGICINAGAFAGSGSMCSTAAVVECSPDNISTECADYVITTCQHFKSCDGARDNAWLEGCIAEGCVAETTADPLACLRSTNNILSGQAACD